ncbi:hypothetical protein KI387_030796, partial [Taxus chinensis]
AEDREFLLRMSYMEIYNEEINDLLAPEHRKLQVHESLERGIFVAGLREEIVASPEHVLQLMESGESHRHIGETNMNVYSSRSHTIFRMVIESRDKNADDSVGMSCDAVRVSVLNLVDLAGSERAAKTGAEGTRLKEGSHINKSLMTLGTVINKLSEGVESQGGHVPYRDSKLTRILQPALGGNAKTAIICNITPALIHVDETKGTLQFASRALRVTNCAQVNEVLTDAALLKRQKKEIEELRAKLQGSHAEHPAEEILNLRNTLLQSELERERIALELQEEKKAQAERERQLKEQAQKIENLSTIVLYSAMDDREKHVKKNNRRETWCPSAPLKEFSQEESIWPSKGTLGEIVPGRRDRDLPPPFQKLCEDQESSSHTSSKDFGVASGQEIVKEAVDVSSSWAECALPDANASVNVTDRKKKSPVESMTLNEARDELLELQKRYQDLECECENQRKLKNSEIEDLKKRLAKAEAAANKQQKVNKLHLGQSTDRRGKSLTGWESEVFVMNKQIQDEVKTLELEKLYMQRDLDRLLELAKEEKENANRALEELQHELGETQEAAAKNKEQLDSALSEIKLLKKKKVEGVDQILSEFDQLRIEVDSLRDTTNEVQSVAGDSVQSISLAKTLLQEFSRNVVDIKLELHHMEMMSRLSECAPALERGDRRKYANVKIISQRVIEDVANLEELDRSTATNQLPTSSCSGSELVPSGGLCYDMKQDSKSSAQEPSEEEICASSITKGESGANASLIELPGSQKLPLSGQLDKGPMLKCAEIMSSALAMPNMELPCGVDILAFLKYEKQHAMKLLGYLRHLFQNEELLSDTLMHTSEVEEMLSEFQHAISESNRLVKSIWMQGRSKSWSDIELTEVHLANSGVMPDSCPVWVNKMTLIPSMDGTCSVPVDGNMDCLRESDVGKEVNDTVEVIVGLDDEIKGLRGKVECLEAELAMAIQEKSTFCEAESALLKQLQSVQAALQLSNDEKLHLEEVHTQTSIKLQASEKEMESNRQELELLLCQKVEEENASIVIEGLNAEIKSLREKIECIETELAMAIRERSRYSEAEAGVLEKLDSFESSLQLLNKEKEHLEEVHKQALIKLQATEKEMENNRHDLELFQSQKVDEQNASIVVEGLNAEIKSLRGKAKCMEAELATAIQERSRYSEAETRVLEKLHSFEADFQSLTEEKEHLEELHKQTFNKLMASEKELESHMHDLDALCKSLQQCNSEKKEAEEKICQLEVFLCQKVEEKNASANEHKHSCEYFLKMTDELEKNIEEQNASVNAHKSICEALLKTISDVENDVQQSVSQKIEEHKMLISNHENTCDALRKKIDDLETEKAVMSGQISNGHKKLEELNIALEGAKQMQEEQGKTYTAEKTQLLTEVSSLRKEIAKSASSAVTKERENLRKDLEKTKLRLKDTEAKLRNVLQEKSKLEAEKANTDREIKHLRGQSNLLQRDISKRESLADKRRDSRAFDVSKTKNQLGFLEQSLQLKTMELERANFDHDILQERYKNMERTLSEVQEKLGGSESELFVASEEKEALASQLEVISEKLKVTSSELDSLHEKHALLNQQFHERENICRHLEDSLSAVLKDKEEIALQLTDVFLQLEEEKAVCSSREKESMEALKEEETRKLSMVNAEVSVLKEDMEKLKMELESRKDQCKRLSDQLSLVAVNSQEERRASSLELDELREELHRSVAEHEITENAMRSIIEDLKSRAEVLTLQNEKLAGEVVTVRNELERVTREGDEICKRFAELSLKLEEARVEKFTALSEQAILKDSCREIQFKLISATDSVQALTERTVILNEELANEKINFIKETTKLEVRLRLARAKLEAYAGRFTELVEEHTVMHRRFKEDSRKLKEQLVAARLESFELKKEASERGVSYSERNAGSLPMKT